MMMNRPTTSVTRSPQQGERRQSGWTGSALASVLILSALGPYVFGPVRLEQLLIYGVALLYFPQLVLAARRLPALTGLTLVATLLIMGVNATGAGASALSFTADSTLPALESMTFPVVTLLLFWHLAEGRAHDLLRVVALGTLLLACVNSGVAITQIFYDLSDLLSQHWWSVAPADSVGYRAMTNGRLVGLVNQPAAAGLLYSLGLLCAVYLLSRRAILLSMAVTLIAIGGLLAVSKLFLLIGIPVAVWYALMVARDTVKAVATTLVVVASLYLLSFAAAERWAGFGYLQRLRPTGDVDLVELYTAGRYSADSSLRTTFSGVLSESPLFGLGADGTVTVLDSAWLQILVYTGLVGVALWAAMLASWVLYCLPMRSDQRGTRTLLLAVVVLLLVASFGFPVFTANRIALPLWALLAVLLAARNCDASISSRVDHLSSRSSA